MNLLPMRLPPGVDLRKALEEAVRGEGAASAFVVSGIGSLVDPRLRFADASAQTCLTGPFEMLSLVGSLTPDGAHLHMTVAGEHGAVVGGHVVYGNKIRTTAEVLLVWQNDWKLSREFDSATGFKELVVRRTDCFSATPPRSAKRLAERFVLHDVEHCSLSSYRLTW